MGLVRRPEDHLTSNEAWLEVVDESDESMTVMNTSEETRECPVMFAVEIADHPE